MALLFTFSALLLFPRLRVNSNFNDYVSDKIENKVYLKQLDSIFGGSEMIVVMLQGEDVLTKSTLERLELISVDLEKLEGIDRIISPLDAMDISYENGFMKMDPLFDGFPNDNESNNLFKEKIRRNPMAQRFFADDFTLVSLILTKNNEVSDLIIDDLKDIVEGHPGNENVLIGGLPFIRYSISGNIKRDLVFLVPLALVLMVLMLFFSFREWKGVFIPFVIVVMSCILSFGIMAFLGWTISLITILMPIMLIAIANDYGIHMIARYQELVRGETPMTMKEICKQTYKDLKRPIVITGLTTIGGVLGLLTHTMIPAAQLGILIALGISFALMLSVWFLPALLSFFALPKAEGNSKSDKISIADRWLNRFSRWVTIHPKRILVISLSLCALSIIGIFYLKVDTNIEGYFLGKSEVRRSTELINNKFGGSQFISILFRGDMLSPELLKRMEGYEEDIEKEPSVGSVSSPVTLLKELSKGFYEPKEKGYNQIPATADEAYQFLEVYSMSDNGDAIEQFMDYDYETGRILISLKDGSNRAGKEMLQRLKEITKDDAELAFITGTCLTKIELADMVINGQVKSLMLGMVVVFVLLGVIFRSTKAGLLSSLPLSVAILVLFGLMGFFGIALDIATALLSSIMIGVGIDYTIHFLWRFKVERRNGFTHKDAAHITLTTAGRGIVFNAFSVIIGFLVLSFSNFAPLRYFGVLIVISISTCLISALLLVPSIVIITKPKFLEPK